MRALEVEYEERASESEEERGEERRGKNKEKSRRASVGRVTLVPHDPLPRFCLNNWGHHLGPETPNRPVSFRCSTRRRAAREDQLPNMREMHSTL